MEFPKKIIVKSESETIKFAEQFSNLLVPGDIIALIGNLGSGKTFFVKSALSAFGFTLANSPTFTIVNVYSTKFKIHHFDFYRIKKIEELYDIGFEDYIMDQEAVSFIEWADLFPEIVPMHRYEIVINSLNDFEREIIINKL